MRLPVLYPIVAAAPPPPRGAPHLNLGGDPVARGTLAAALDAGTVRMSPPTRVPAVEGRSVLVAHPVSSPRGRAIGVVVGVVDVRSLAAVAGWVAGPASFRVSEGSATIAARGEVDEGVRATSALGGQRWEIAVSVCAQPRDERWAAAVVGLVLALAVASLVAQAARRDAYARRMLARELTARQTAPGPVRPGARRGAHRHGDARPQGRIQGPNTALEEMTGRAVSGAALASGLRPHHESGDALPLEATPREGSSAACSASARGVSSLTSRRCPETGPPTRASCSRSRT